MKLKRIVWVMLLIAALLSCWLFVHSVRDTPVKVADTRSIRLIPLTAKTDVHAHFAAASKSGTVTGILSDPKFREVIRALEQRGGNEILKAPKVATARQDPRIINRSETFIITNK
jgi:hypothetical protein